MAKQSRTKNEFMTLRDPGEELREKIDRLRVIEGRGETIPPTRTEMLHILVDRELARNNRQ